MRDRVAHKVDLGDYHLESVDCCICRSGTTEELSEKDRYGLKLSVVVCRECGLVFTTPRMTQASFTKFYDDEYRPLYHGKAYTAEDLFRKGIRRGHEIANFISDAGYDLHSMRVLEVGCGAGGLLSYFEEAYSCETKGCDFGTDGLRYGSKNFGLDLSVGGIESISTEWRPQLIIYSHVFEHVLDLAAECQAIRKLLDDDGLLYVEVPGIKNITSAYQSDILLYLQNAHTYHFSLTSLSNLMQKNGFRMVVGNEFVRSLFAKSEKTFSFESDYLAVRQYLERVERAWYKRLLNRWVVILKSCGRVVRRIAGAQG